MKTRFITPLYKTDNTQLYNTDNTQLYNTDNAQLYIIDTRIASQILENHEPVRTSWRRRI